MERERLRQTQGEIRDGEREIETKIWEKEGGKEIYTENETRRAKGGYVRDGLCQKRTTENQSAEAARVC